MFRVEDSGGSARVPLRVPEPTGSCVPLWGILP